MKILVIVAHPTLETSIANRSWANAVEKQPNVTVHRIYEAYPDWNINIEKEQKQVEEHDRIVLQFPFYWYSCPPLLKKWMDDVLTYGWAFGSQGNKLHEKEMLVAMSTGSPLSSYQPGGEDNYTIGELLRPFQATSNYIGMTFLPPFVFGGIYRAEQEKIIFSAKDYVKHVLDETYCSPQFVLS